MSSFNAEINDGYETPDDQVLRETILPPGAPLRPTQDPVGAWDLFDPNGSPTKVTPMRSKDLPGAPIIRKSKSKRPRGGSVAVCPRKNPSMFHPSVFLTDFGSHASPLRTAKLDDKKRPCPPPPVKERPSRF
jgi:hypothetical protein